MMGYSGGWGFMFISEIVFGILMIVALIVHLMAYATMQAQKKRK